MSSNSSVGLIAETSPDKGAIAGFLQGVRKHAARVAKSSFGIAVCGAGAWFLFKSFFLNVSSRAVVGAGLLVLRAPIDGLVQEPVLKVGRYVESNAVLGVIENPWADDGTVQDLEIQLAATDVEIASITPLLAEFEGIASSLKTGTAVYQARRVAQLRAVAAEAEARIKAGQAQSQEAEARLARAKELAVDGVVSAETHSGLERDAVVGQQTVAALQRNLDGIEAQLDAAQKGINIDSSGMGSDRPYSKQRLDELKIELVRWRQRLNEQQKRREKLVSKLEEAKQRLRRFAHATLPSPGRARVWEVLSAPGTYVSKGSPVVSIVNCDDLMVVAAVSERVFKRLVLSSKARFTVRDTGERHWGTVVGLLGPEGVSRAVIAPGMLSEEGGSDPYRVLLSFPSLAGAASSSCSIGQSGEVTFL